MKALPSTLAGWVIFYVAMLAFALIVVWAWTGKTPPTELTAVISMIVTGFLAFLRGDSEMPKDAKITTESTTTVETPKDV